MKSLSVGDEAGDLAEPWLITARVKNRNPTVPCWLSLMSAALVTELAASESPPHPASPVLHPSSSFYSSQSFSIHLSFIIILFFHHLPILTVLLYLRYFFKTQCSSSSTVSSTSSHHMCLNQIKQLHIAASPLSNDGCKTNPYRLRPSSYLPCYRVFLSLPAFNTCMITQK